MAGDVNNDGYDDMLVGARQADVSTNANAGTAYLIYGPASSGSLSGASAILQGINAQDFAGYGVAGNGDVNGDGYGDVLVNAYRADDAAYNAGTTYLMSGPLTGTLSLSTADAAITGENSSDQAGSVLDMAGDINGDGYGDIILGAQHYDDGANTDAGAVYIVLGPATGTIALSSADAKLTGEGASDFAGRSVAQAGDVNGDGNDDVFIGAKKNDNNGTDAGAAYLLLGPVSGTASLSTADAIFEGASAGDEAGIAVANAGDVDNDGNLDMLVGAYLESTNGSQAGAAYLILGGGY